MAMLAEINEVTRDLLGWQKRYPDECWISPKQLNGTPMKIRTGLRIATEQWHKPSDGYWRPDNDYSQALLLLKALNGSWSYSWEKKRCHITITSHGLMTRHQDGPWRVGLGNLVTWQALVAHWKAVRDEAT